VTTPLPRSQPPFALTVLKKIQPERGGSICGTLAAMRCSAWVATFKSKLIDRKSMGSDENRDPGVDARGRVDVRRSRRGASQRLDEL
jgi:hypothetical protein